MEKYSHQVMQMQVRSTQPWVRWPLRYPKGISQSSSTQPMGEPYMASNSLRFSHFIFCIACELYSKVENYAEKV